MTSIFDPPLREPMQVASNDYTKIAEPDCARGYVSFEEYTRAHTHTDNNQSSPIAKTKYERACNGYLLYVAVLVAREGRNSRLVVQN